MGAALRPAKGDFMPAIRKLLLALTVVGLALTAPLSTEARPQCSTGPTCSPSSNPCPSLCQQQGWPLGLCNLQTGCCVCSD